MIRRVLGTTLAGLCAFTGPLAGNAFAASADASLTLSASGARPGASFTVSPAAASGCPSSFGLQTVALSFTDRVGVAHAIGSAQTEADGSWAAAVAQLPVAGLDADGTWSDQPVAPGPGTVSATCFDADSSADAGDSADDDAPGGDSTDDSTDSTDDSTDTDVDDGSDSPENPGDDDSGDMPGAVTKSYPGIAFTATGSAPKLKLSAAVVKPGDSVTVTPAEGCLAGASTVQIAVVDLTDVSDADSGEVDSDPGSGDGDSGDDSVDQPTEPLAGLPTATATTSATGGWTALTLALPADLETGDYAVTADCSTGGVVTSSYDAATLAVGTVLIGQAVCGAHNVTAALTGTYGDAIAGKGDLTLPAKLALAGDGPWKVQVRSATTGQVLATRTVVCAKPQYQGDVSKTELSDSNKPRARVCNTGRAPVAAVLQVLKGKKYQKADKETLDPGKCAWLTGPKLERGDRTKVRVLLDAPGKHSDEVMESFTLKRGRA
jgi:hypothetical protein